jgi:hypothetical protein
MILSLRQLAAFSDEFSEFVTDPPPDPLDFWECTYSPSPQPMVRIAEPVLGGWIIFRKERDQGEGDVYLLVEIEQGQLAWKSWFAPDPKKALEYLYSQYSGRQWVRLLPLIRQAHKEAHPEGDNTRNLTYLQDLVVRALHHGNPAEVLSSTINQLN